MSCTSEPVDTGVVATTPTRIRYTAVSERLGPEANSRLHVFGVALADFTGDGVLDITLPHADGVLFLRGDGQGGFVRHDAGPAAGTTTRGRSAIYADLEGDGDLDLLVTTRGLAGKQDLRTPPVLLRNDGQGHFVDITTEAGLLHSGLWDGAAFGDLDGDGDLDLVLAGAFSPNDDGTWTPGTSGGENFVYLGDGEGHFTEAEDGLGCKGPLDGESWGVRLFDRDLDGDLDLVIGNDSAPSTVCVNLGGGRFQDITAAEVARQGNKHIVGAMGLGVGDLNGDGCPDLYSTLFGPAAVNAMSASGAFPNVYGTLLGEGVDPSAAVSGWGVVLFDPDLDGDQDVVWGAAADFVVPGGDDLSPGAMAVMENLGIGAAGGLRDVSSETSPIFSLTHNAFGLARGDIDGDGDEDLLVGEDSTVQPVGGGLASCQLLLNTSDLHDRHVITLRLRQPGKNPRAVGATVIASVGGRRVLYSLAAGDSYLSTHGDALHLGLGAQTVADFVHVIWPDGFSQTWTQVPEGPLNLTRGEAPCTPAGSCEGLVPWQCDDLKATEPACAGPPISADQCAGLCGYMQRCHLFGNNGPATVEQCLDRCQTCPPSAADINKLMERPCNEEG